jgi:hypothetical protein
MEIQAILIHSIQFFNNLNSYLIYKLKYLDGPTIQQLSDQDGNISKQCKLALHMSSSRFQEILNLINANITTFKERQDK